MGPSVAVWAWCSPDVMAVLMMVATRAEMMMMVSNLDMEQCSLQCLRGALHIVFYSIEDIQNSVLI